MKKLRKILTLVILATTSFCFSQGEANWWYFGYNAGLHFPFAGPVAVTNGLCNTSEGSASISDPAGNLLFYTDGITVWNKLNAVMANGTGLLGNPSSTQSGVIIKKPGSTTLYYIFTTAAQLGAAGLCYSIVDISLAAGNGSVTVKNVPLQTPSCEKVTGVRHCNNVDVWVVSHDWNSNNFRTFLLTAGGVGAPVISSAGLVASGSSAVTIGQLKASPNGRKLGSCIWDASVNRFELFDFNNLTGVVSNPILLPQFAATSGAYGCEFSPDGTKFYGTLITPGQIRQWDLCAGSNAAIAASGVLVGTSSNNFNGSLQLGPDGKLYVARLSVPWVGVINNPNTLGVACGYVDNGVSLAGKNGSLGLPNFVPFYFKTPPPPFTFTVGTVSCLTAQFNAPSSTTTSCASSGYTINAYNWNFGDPPSGAANTSTLTSPTHVYPGPGTYSVTLILNYPCGADTLKQNITIVTPSITVNTTSATCATPGSATVTATGGAGGYTYTWSPTAQTTSVATGLGAGIYTVQVKDLTGCIVTATTNLGSNNAMTTTITTASVACNAAATGTAGITVGGGSGTYNYTWTPGGQITQTVLGLTAGIYSVTVKDAISGCTSTQTLQITQPPALTLTAVASTPSACAGSNITLTASNSGGTGAFSYNWTSGPLTNTYSVSQATGGNYTYSVTSTDANNCAANKTVSVTFVNNPTVTASSATVCLGNTATLTAAGATNYTWTPGNVNGTTFTLTPAANTAISILGAIGTCTASATTSVTVNALPTPTAQSNTPLCVGQTLNLTGLGGTTYSWTGPAVYTSNAQNPSITSITAANAGTYSLSVTDANGCNNNTTTNVVINALPVIVVTNPTVCLNQTINLTANGGTSYSWSGPGGFASALQNPTLPNATISMSGQYTVTVTGATGCTNTAISTATVYALPNPAIVSNTPCVGTSLNLNGSGGAVYSWSGPNGFVSAAQNPNINPVTMLANGTYSLLVTSGTCSASITLPVTVNPLPVIAVTNTNVTCFGLQNGTSTASVSVGTAPFNYVWSSFPVQNTSTAIGLGAGNYNVQVTDNNGCVSTQTTQITQPAALNVTINSSTTSVCAGLPINLNASSNGGTGAVTYSWNPGPTGSAYSVTENNAGNYTYTVTGMDANNCTSTQMISLTFFPSPTVTATSATVCAGQVAMLSANGANSYVWSPGGATGSTFTTTGTSNINVTVIGTSNGCSNQATAVLVVNPAPNINITTPGTNGCLPLCLDLKSATTSSIVSYSWSINNAALGSGAQISNYCFTTTGANTIGLSVVDANGCSNTAYPINITLNPQPVADFNYDPIKPLESVDLVSFTDASYAANIASWNWYFMNNGQYTSQLQNPTFMYADAGEYVIALVVKSDKGCTDTILKSILVGEDFGIYVPNTFTPNGDGLNDIFYGKGYGIKKFEMQIFDRWGEKVFTSTDLNEAWDGSYQGRGSKQVQEGVYTWRIKLTNVFGKSKELTGHVTLIK